MNLSFPLHFDNNGRTAETDYDRHIRNLIGQVLFTSPGERVNRPDFGCGLLQLVFEPNSDELATTTQFLILGSLQQWLGELIEVTEVQTEIIDSTLEVTVVYKIRRTQEPRIAHFLR